MPFPSQSPYDILGLLPSASLPEITQAYVRASRERKYPSVVLAQAFSDLRNAAKRAEHDLFVVSQERSAEELINLLLGSVRPRSNPAPDLPFDLLLTGLHADSGSLQPRPLPSLPLEISFDSVRLLDAERSIPEVPFPEGDS
jgi:hypothetical protein